MPTAEHRERLRREAVEPVVDRHRLAGIGVVAEAGPVAVAVDLLVGDRALDDQHERLDLAAGTLEEPFEEVVGAAVRAALEVDQRPVHGDLRQSRQSTERDLFDRRLGRRCQRNRIAVATEAGVDPQDVDDQFVRRGFRSGHTRSFVHAASMGFGARTAGASTGGRSGHRIPVLSYARGRTIVNECVFHLHMARLCGRQKRRRRRRLPPGRR